MSAYVIQDKEAISNKMKAIRGQIVDIEILTRIKYDSNTPLLVQNKVEQLKQNIFDLDISITNIIIE